MKYDKNKEPKAGDIAICSDEYMLEAYLPDHYLFMYAQIEAGMEGEVICFVGDLEEEEVVIDFHGTCVLADLDDFQDGTFFIKGRITRTELKLALVSTKPTLVLIK
jgi:hypothetical protein